MKVFLGVILLGMVSLTCLLPYIITLLISLDTVYVRKERKTQMWIRGILFTVSILGNSAALLVTHRVLLDRWNVLKTAKQIVGFSFAYQEVKFYSIFLIFTAISAGVLGFLLRWILPRLLRKVYGRSFLTGRRRTALFLIGTLVCAIGIGTMFFSFNGVSNLVINEVGGYNKSMALDESQTICDYIELYNQGSLDWVVQKLYLSDDSSDLGKREIFDCTVPAKGYQIIKLDTSDLAVSRKGNETIYLSDELGRILDQVTITALDADVSYCRTTDGADAWQLAKQTPSASNDQAVRVLDAQVTFSHEGGFYDDAFYVSIETQSPYEIYYTLDGSTPTKDSLHYTQPVYVYDKSEEPNVWRSLQRVVLDWQDYTPDTTPVSKAFVIRAAAIAGDGAVGDVATVSYFVGQEEFEDRTVVSLVADPEELFGEDGIYVTGTEYDESYLAGKETDQYLANFLQVGRTSEIKGHMEYFSENDAFSQDVGLRVSGGISRRYALKRFSVFSRTQYSGSAVFAGNLFEDVTTRRIQLRQGYANVVCQRMVADRAVATQKSIPAAVFVNGEFWYDTNIFEKYDEHYFQEYYGVPEDNVIVCKNSNVNDWDPEDMETRREVFRFLEDHDMTTEESYIAFGELVDLQSYADYMCANIYFGNIDFTDDHNSVWWRSREVSDKPYEDGKWRFAMYDLDAMGGGDLAERAKENTFTYERDGTSYVRAQTLYMTLRENPWFRRQFALTFMDMVNTNFRYENVAAVLDAFDDGTPREGYHTFFQTRAPYIIAHVAEEFSLTGSVETITLGTNGGGTVQLNTITPDLSDGTWSGEYFTDYPVTLTAVPEDGYEFAGWEGDISATDPTVEVTLAAGGMKINARFEKKAES